MVELLTNAQPGCLYWGKLSKNILNFFVEGSWTSLKIELPHFCAKVGIAFHLFALTKMENKSENRKLFLICFPF